MCNCHENNINKKNIYLMVWKMIIFMFDFGVTWLGHIFLRYTTKWLYKVHKQICFKLIESSCISYLPFNSLRNVLFDWRHLRKCYFTPYLLIEASPAKGSMKETPMLEIEMRCQNLVTMVKTWYIHRFQARRVIKHPYMRWSHKQAYAEYCMWQFWFWHHIHYKI